MFDDLVSLATGGLDKIVNDLYSSAKGAIKKKVEEKLSLKNIGGLLDNISQIGKVKTIYNPDAIQNLDKIYCNEAITFEKIGTIEGVRFFNANQILIQGGPGQGKSLYLKHLCLEEAKNQNFIPVFVEFRNLNFERALKEELVIAIRNYGIDVDDDLFDYLAKSEKLLFILDGFDEVPSDARLRTARELEQIARAYKNLKIVISSRPDAGLGGSVYYKTFEISPLSLKVQKQFLRYLLGNEKECQPIEQIIENSEFLSDVTRTPLLLTLFAITYKARQFKPDSISEFYSIIFPTMLYRHDRMKVGFERERSSRLSDYQMQRIFEVFSFVSLKGARVRFSSIEFKSYLNTALQHERIEASIEDELIEDITLITALIVRDGFDVYSYAHKSIQEYFASVFISRIPDDSKSQFYEHVILNYSEYRKWQNVINFLSTIDVYNYMRYFLLPVRKKSIGLNDSGKIVLNYTIIKDSIGTETKAQIDEDGSVIEIYWDDTYSSSTFPAFTQFIKKEVASYLMEERTALADYLAFCDVDKYQRYRYSDKTFIINIIQYIRESKEQKKLARYISRKIKRSAIMAEISQLEKDISMTENMNRAITAF